MKRLAIMLTLLLCWPLSGMAIDTELAFQDPVLQARYEKLGRELRCLVCQNQTVADSNAGLAKDLRQQVKELLQQGKSDKEILDYMVARYGNFVRFTPPVNNQTIFLWAAPAVMVLGGLVFAVMIIRNRSKLPVGDEETTAGNGEAQS